MPLASLSSRVFSSSQEKFEVIAVAVALSTRQHHDRMDKCEKSELMTKRFFSFRKGFRLPRSFRSWSVWLPRIIGTI